MRRLTRVIGVLSAFLTLALLVQAGENEAATVIDKAIKAHFPKGMDAKKTALRTKNKGTLHVMGLDLEFVQQVSVAPPGKFKEVMDITVLGKKVSVTSVYDGKNAWIRADDKDVPVTDDILNAFKEASYSMGMMRGVFVKDKDVKYSLIGEADVKGKKAIGVTVSSKDKKDVSIYFDKQTHLITKIEMRTRDIQSGQEVMEERFVTEYQTVDGQKVAKKVEVLRDGKALLEAEVIETQMFEKLDDSEFAKPK